MTKQQRSKRARKHKKQALWAFKSAWIAKWFSHPSHVPAKKQ